MSSELPVLMVAAVSIALIHTLLGPDHYLPFVALSKSCRWPLRKTLTLTGLCGLGHVLSSVVLGMIGVAFGITITRLEALDSMRGNLAAWMLMAFGLVYLVWGLRKAWRNRPHRHAHPHANGISHEHVHTHRDEHGHVHHDAGRGRMTPWILFVIFVLGPCEPLIPLLMYPAAKDAPWDAVWVVVVFGAVTVATMLSVVTLSTLGLGIVTGARYTRYAHALAGCVILLCGIAIGFLGL